MVWYAEGLKLERCYKYGNNRATVHPNFEQNVRRAVKTSKKEQEQLERGIKGMVMRDGNEENMFQTETKVDTAKKMSRDEGII